MHIYEELTQPFYLNSEYYVIFNEATVKLIELYLSLVMVENECQLLSTEKPHARHAGAFSFYFTKECIRAETSDSGIYPGGGSSDVSSSHVLKRFCCSSIAHQPICDQSLFTHVRTQLSARRGADNLATP
jgi:hypothetical protein